MLLVRLLMAKITFIGKTNNISTLIVGVLVDANAVDFLVVDVELNPRSKRSFCQSNQTRLNKDPRFFNPSISPFPLFALQLLIKKFRHLFGIQHSLLLDDNELNEEIVSQGFVVFLGRLCWLTWLSGLNGFLWLWLISINDNNFRLTWLLYIQR